MEIQHYIKDRFGNVPYAAVMVDGTVFTFTREDYYLARQTAAVCQCGRCASCTVVAHVRENSK
jgi:hypothetical protein